MAILLHRVTAVAEQPSEWDADDLSKFFETARRNALATFDNLPDSYRRLRDIDALFTELFTNYRDPEHILGAALALRCHSALRAAAQLTISGQIPEAFMVLRGALELALYAHHAASSEQRAMIWLHRHDSEDTRKRCSREFTPRTMLPVLREKDAGVAKMVGQLYDRAIDYGAHPNAAGVLTTMTQTSRPAGDEYIAFNYITGDEMLLRFVIRAWSQIALSCLDMLSYVLSARFLETRIIRKTIPMREGL